VIVLEQNKLSVQLLEKMTRVCLQTAAFLERVSGHLGQINVDFIIDLEGLLNRCGRFNSHSGGYSSRARVNSSGWNGSRSSIFSPMPT